MRYKRLKKRLTLSAALLLGSGLTSLEAQAVYVKESSNIQTAYTLSNVRKITFSGGDAIVQKIDNNTDVYAISDLSRLSFADVVTQTKEQTESEKSNPFSYPISVNDELILDLKDAEAKGTISVFTLEGKLLQEQKIDDTSATVLNLSHLPKGIYLYRFISHSEVKTARFIKK